MIRAEVSLSCEPCLGDHHEACDTTVLVPDEFNDGGRQYAACGCSCGGGAEAWQE